MLGRRNGLHPSALNPETQTQIPETPGDVKNLTSAVVKKVKVGGIRLSRELVQVDVAGQSADEVPGASLLLGLAEQKINLACVTASLTQTPVVVSFCVAADDFDAVQRMIDGKPDLRQQIRITSPVCCLTVFPHRWDLSLLGRLLSCLSTAGCPIYGVASSISTLSFNTNYWSIGRALAALESMLELPLNHSPYKQEFLIRQI